MLDTNITYRVVGRYMDGQKLTGYHLVGSDGSQLPVNKERTIFMISSGKIENMRIQSDTSSDKNGIIIRGKGVNLNNLPVYDERKQTFRGDDASQSVATNKVQPKKDSGFNAMGQFEITARIMKGTQCIGYVVIDGSGAQSKFSRKKILEIGLKKMLKNAEVQKFTKDGQETQFILRGSGCNLSELPILILSDDGRIIDPSKKESGNSYRAMRVSRSGIVVSNNNNIRLQFSAGDFILCGVNGEFKIENVDNMSARYIVDKEASSAICDKYLSNVNDYSIEFFGQSPIQLSQSIILKWGIVKIK